MNLISIDKVSKTLKDSPLFDDVSIGIDQNDKIGFIGANGAGKSTFLKILAGKMKSDTGEISCNKESTVSCLEQIPEAIPGVSVKDYLYYGNTPIIRLIRDYHKCLEHLGNSPEYSEEKLEELTNRMEKSEAWNCENIYYSYLTELGFENLDQQTDTLSGGMLKKAALARVLSAGSEVLLLDEPTNHLDIETIEWLEEYLKKEEITFLMITHDRYFLDRVCRQIMEISNQQIRKYEGNYTTFLERKQQRLEHQKKEQERINVILRREKEWLSRGPKARTGKDKKRKERIRNLMDRQTSEELAMADFSGTFRRLGKKILELHGVSSVRGGREIIQPFSYFFRKNERIGIIGPNGSGKTTLLDMMTGRLLLSGGRMEKGVNTCFGYFDQYSRRLKPEMTVLGYLTEICDKIRLPDGNTITPAGFLERFLFPSSMHRILIERLSGGEKRRLELIRTLLENPNFLILDEPTNDLDLETLNRLEDFLHEYTGCLIIVSHDRAFLDRTCDFLFIFDGSGQIKGYGGSCSEYQEYRKELSRKEKKENLEKSGKKQVNREKKGLSFKEKRRMEELFSEIEIMETHYADLELWFSGSDYAPEQAAEKQKEYNALREKIDLFTEEWEKLASIEN